MQFIFHTLLFDPLYNTLVFLSGLMPGDDLGLAVVALTLMVKMILFPLQHRMAKTQNQMRALEPEIKKIKDQHKKDRTIQAQKTMELYKKHGINPFAGIVTLIIQLPILLALYWVFKESFEIHPEFLYPFVSPPQLMNTSFLGLFDVSGRSYFLAIMTGVTQFFQMRYALPPPAKVEGDTGSFAGELARNFNIQMRYVLPAMVVFISLSLPGAIALYWTTSNLFALGHELVVKRKAKNLFPAVTPRD